MRDRPPEFGAHSSEIRMNWVKRCRREKTHTGEMEQGVEAQSDVRLGGCWLHALPDVNCHGDLTTCVAGLDDGRPAHLPVAAACPVCQRLERVQASRIGG